MELLVAGALPEGESQSVLSHLGECPSCRNEAALLAAVRSTLPSQPSGPECLSDEEISLLQDDLLPEEHRSRALAHLASCQNCLGALASLDRALDQAEATPHSPPPALLKKAIAVGVQEEKKESWFSRLLDLSPAWRFGLAAAAAAGVFFVTILLTFPGPDPDPTASNARVAEKTDPSTRPVVARSPETGQETRSQRESPDREADREKTGQPQDPSRTRLAIAQAKQAGNWLQRLSDKQRLSLLTRLRPERAEPRITSGTALTARVPRTVVAEAYLLGRSAGALDDFSGQLDSPPQTRNQLVETTRSMATRLKKRPGFEKLSNFSSKLAKNLAQADHSADTIRRRIEVLTAGLEESVSTREDLEAGYRLGRLSWRLELVATALDLGHPLPRKAWPSRKSITRVRRLLKKTAVLPEASRAEVLKGLETIERTASYPPGRDKASRILEQLTEIDRQIRGSR